MRSYHKRDTVFNITVSLLCFIASSLTRSYLLFNCFYLMLQSLVFVVRKGHCHYPELNTFLLIFCRAVSHLIFTFCLDFSRPLILFLAVGIIWLPNFW
jgi:hypothetical protein